MTVLLPSILAAEAGGQGQFELEAGTVGEALRALPVENMLFDEHGELRRLVNVYVDGVDIRGGDGVESALAGGEELRVVQAVAGGRLGKVAELAPVDRFDVVAVGVEQNARSEARTELYCSRSWAPLSLNQPGARVGLRPLRPGHADDRDGEVWSVRSAGHHQVCVRHLGRIPRAAECRCC